MFFKNSGKIVSFRPPNNFGKNFSSFSHRTKLTKFFVPTNLRNFYRFCPRHKSRKFLQVFVPLAKLRDKIFRPQKCTLRIVTGGDVPTRNKACTRIVTGGRPPPPVRKREFGLTTTMVIRPVLISAPKPNSIEDHQTLTGKTQN